jgi:hypothetical protein
VQLYFLQQDLKRNSTNEYLDILTLFYQDIVNHNTTTGVTAHRAPSLFGVFVTYTISLAYV